MKNNNKSMWITLGVIILALIVIWSVKIGGSKKTITETDTAVVDTAELTEDVGEGSVNAPATGAVPATMSYQNALIKYKDFRIQIDATCQAFPKTMTFKNKTNIMIDNRSAATRTVKIGSTYTIKPYSFKIINVSSSTLPATWLVDCDKQQNVATILLQK